MTENTLPESNLRLERAETERRFRSNGYTLENVRRDFPQWRKGRARYLLWAIDVDREAVRGKVASAGLHLLDLLLDDYRRQPHVTLALCGFSSGAPQLPDDVSLAQIEAQVAALRQTGLQPFSIDIGFLSSFSSAPFLHVLDADDGIAALRTCLAPANCGDWPVDYTAHVTVGLYNGAWPSAQVSRRLANFHCGPAVRHSVQRISLMSYAADDISGPLTTLAEVHLDGATIVWHEAAPF